jgi:hypothetical protein
MKEKLLVFIIKSQERVNIPFPIDVKKHPIHEHYLTEVKEKTFVYKYRPDSSLDEEKYIEFLKNEFKIKYNALSVDVGTLDDYLRLKK